MFAWGSDSDSDHDSWSLPVAGPDNSGRVLRLGPEPLAWDPSEGLAWGNPGWYGWKVETAASPAGTGRRPRCGVLGKVLLIRKVPLEWSQSVGTSHQSTTPNYMGRDQPVWTILGQGAPMLLTSLEQNASSQAAICDIGSYARQSRRTTGLLDK